MFLNLFDLSYERNLEEALVFYFFYLAFAFFIAGIFYSTANFFYFLSSYFSGYPSAILTYYVPFLTFFTPFIFYTVLSFVIVLKKRLKDRYSLHLIAYTVLITFLIPLSLGVCFGFGFLGYDKGFQYGIAGTFIDFFFPELIIGCIPLAILTTKEDRSLSKIIKQMEQEKLEHEKWIEKQLLIERAIRLKQEEIKNTKNDEKEE